MPDPSVRRLPWEGRSADVALGLTVLGWGLYGLSLAPGPERLAPPRLTLSALQIVVGTLLMTRKPLLLGASFWEMAAALPSLVASGEAMWLARPLHRWPLGAEILFVAGGVGAALSLLFLGRCFAVLPGVRGVVVRGPYRLIRHPAYATQLVMLAGTAWAIGLPWGALVWVVVAAWVVLRILAEERALRRSPDYLAYAERVRWRLVPRIW